MTSATLLFLFSQVSPVWLCDPMDCSTPGFPFFTISGSLLKLMSIESVMSVNHLIFCCRLLFSPQSFPASGSFPMSKLFPSGGQSIGASASASVLSMNIQGWFPWRLTGLIFLQSRDSQESSPAPQFESINYLVLSLLYGPTLTSVHDYWKNHSFDYTDIYQPSDVSAFFIHWLGLS